MKRRRASGSGRKNGVIINDEHFSGHRNRGRGFADGEGAVYSVTGLQKVPGISENTFTYAFADGTKSGNYEVTCVKGTLTVTNREALYEITAAAAGAPPPAA